MHYAGDGYELSVDTLLITQIVVPCYGVHFGLVYTRSTTEVKKAEDTEVGQGRRGVSR